MFRILNQIGLGEYVLVMLNNTWKFMLNSKKLQILLKIFAGYIRKDYLHLSMIRSDDLGIYVKVAKQFMVGLSNRDRFEG